MFPYPVFCLVMPDNLPRNNLLLLQIFYFLQAWITEEVFDLAASPTEREHLALHHLKTCVRSHWTSHNPRDQS